MSTRRLGTHRGLGSIVQALISLRKLTVRKISTRKKTILHNFSPQILQEIAVHLPEEERSRVLGDIQKLSKEVERVSLTRRRSDGAAQKARFSFRVGCMFK